MPATPIQMTFSGPPKERSEGGGMYSLIEVPGDYEGVVTDVENYDKTATGGKKGWILHVEIMGCDFTDFLAHTEKAKWKIEQVVAALGFYDMSDGNTETVDPNAWIGQPIGCSVDWQHDPGIDPNYREVKQYFFLGNDEADVPGRETWEDDTEELATL